MTFPTDEQEKRMLRDVAVVGDCDSEMPFYASECASVAADLCNHVKSLLAEIKLLRETVDVVQQHRVDAAAEGFDWKVKALKRYSVYGTTPEQYHAGISKLWKALGITGVQDEDVFTLAANAIEKRDKYKKTLAHIALGTLEGGGSNHSSVHDSVGMADFSLDYPSTKELREMLP